MTARRIPQLGFGVFQIDRRPRPLSAVADGAGDRLPPHRYGGDVPATRRGVGRGHPRRRPRSRRGVHHQQAQQRLPQARRRATRVRRDAREARLRLRRPVPHPLAAADALRWRLRLDMARPSRSSRRTDAPAASVCPTSRSTTWSGWRAKPTTAPAVNQIEVHPYFTNDAVRAYGAEHRIATEAWSPIAQGKVLGDPVVMRIAEAHGQNTCSGRAALAHPARRHRVPEIGDAAADQGEPRSCSTSNSSDADMQAI